MMHGGSAPAATPAPATAPPPAAMNDPVRSAERTTEAVPGALEVTISYSGSVAALPAGAKLFVFVRPVGERIPLGAHSYDARALPVALTFSRPTDGLDREVEVVARLSLAGAVALQPGDIEAVSKPLRFGDAGQRVALTLEPAASTGIAPAPTQ